MPEIHEIILISLNQDNESKILVFYPKIWPNLCLMCA